MQNCDEYLLYRIPVHSIMYLKGGGFANAIKPRGFQMSYDNEEKIELLSTAGEALFGSNWKSELARDIGVNDRSVRQWAAGERTIPSGVIRGLITRLRDRAALVTRTADYLAREIRDFDDYAEIKIIWIVGFNPAIETDITERLDWFDVDGYRYGVTESGRVIDQRGNETELKNATVAELFAVRDAELAKPCID